ncbi:PTHB1 [Asbolus verrucosus]|uniref:PTHB1 n=1 Tax=Asbolus verrucosus TaxID=1661398 RepID=A0A482VTA2_ASBVE|nr:PTHB1 [Asbolus verrucosus]
MSLFKTRTFWSVHCEEEEYFDQNSLLITKLNSESDYIVTGSQSGILRIFKPSCELNDNNNSTGYKVTDLSVEKILNHPILQVGYGRLVSSATVEIIECLRSGVQNILQLAYEHKLRRSAYNFLVGPFGGTQNRDFICVQSLDGLLTFFEQESFSYKLLSEAGQNSLENDDTGKKVNSDWKFNLGEAVMDIDVVEDPNSKENYVMVLGERNIFCINDIDDRIMSLIVSETNNLLIYQNTSLKWSAQLQISPVSVKRAFFHNISGVIVLLSEEGRVECCYLGTEPSLFVAPPLTVQDLDFDKAGTELITLLRIIKNSYTNDIKVTNASAERELTLNVSVSPHLETCTFESNIKNAINNQMCSISIDILPQALFEEVQITVFAQHPLKIEPQLEFFNNLSEKTLMNCYAFMDESGEVPSLNLQVVASFISNLGVPRCVTKYAMLPLNLVLETCPPVKDSECKVTLNINQSPVGLSVLFPEYTGQNSFTAASNAIGFRNVTEEGKVVTILLAKSSERYRLQSDSFASLNLLIEQMVYRLKKHYSNKNDFSVTFNSPLPINEPLQSINKHFNARQKFISLQDQLAQMSSQFRLIQKRLISKFKVKNPTPLSNLELLLEDTYNEMMKITENLEKEMINLFKSQNELSCALHVLVNLIKLMDCNSNVAELIESTFNSFVYDLDGQNWEDVTDASLCYLLRTVLAKSEKDKLRAAHTSFDEVKDISKIEKHFTQVLERIPKGALLETHFPLDGGTHEETDENKEVVDESVPIGSKIGESSSRLLSARRGLLRKRHKIDN